MLILGIVNLTIPFFIEKNKIYLKIYLNKNRKKWYNIAIVSLWWTGLMMRQILDITFVRICVMRRNYNSKFNELTPMGWVVVGGAIVVFILLVVVGVMLLRIL